MIHVHPGTRNAAAPPGGFPPYGDSFARGSGNLKGTTAEGANGGWVWDGWEESGTPNIFIDPSPPKVGSTGAQNTSVFIPSDLASIDMWVEARVTSTTSIAGQFGPAVNVPQYGSAIVQGYVMYMKANNTLSVTRIASSVTDDLGLNVTVAPSNRIGMEIAGNTLRIFVNGTVQGTVADVTDGGRSRLQGRRVGFVTNTAGWAIYQDFLGDNGAYPG